MWAVIDQHQGGNGLPKGLESLYALGKAGKGFRDVAQGANVGPGGRGTTGYPAGTGYDLASGWGSPLLAQLIASWQ
jgi:hypothetical protein